MQEFFYEESSFVKNEEAAMRKFNMYKTLMIISFILSVICFFLLDYFPYDEKSGFLWIPFIIGGVVPVLVFFGLAFLFMKLKNKSYIDYDYTIVSGNVRVSKIIGRVKRKKLLNFNFSSIVSMGAFGSETYNRIFNTPGVKQIYLTNNNLPTNSDNFYYIYVSDGSKKLLIFDCSQSFIFTIYRYGNKTVLEKDFKWFI